MRAGKNREFREKVAIYKKVFGTVDGKEVLMDLMNRYHILNEHDGTPYPEGQRSVVLDIMRTSKINMNELDSILEGE